MATEPLPPEAEAVIQTGMDAAAVEDGIPDEQAEARKEEKAQVERWLNEIKEAREFDKEVWREIATDRGYAAGLSAHDVSVNLIGSAIDVMKSFLYARNPDVAVVPARQTSLPTIERPVAPIPPEDPTQRIAAMTAQTAPDIPGASLLTDPAVQQSLGPILGKYQLDLPNYQQEQMIYQAATMAYTSEMQRRRQVRELRKRFSETLEILISKAWSLADLKGEARTAVGATLTAKIGWMKLAWHEDRGLDPVSTKKLASLQENIALIDKLRAKVAEGSETPNLDAVRQELTETIAGLQAATEVITARGLLIDSVPAEDMTVPIGVTRVAAATGCAPWLAQRVFMLESQACVDFPDVPKDCWKKATRYSQRKPKMSLRVDVVDHPSIAVASDQDASQFYQGTDGKVSEMVAGDGDFLCFHEIWDKKANMVRTVCEGVDRYVRVPHAPEIAVTRFYPFYNMAFVEADGLRYPQSLVQRSRGLQDEYNARRSALKKQRARAKQGILADATALDKDEAGKINTSVEGETTYVHTVGNVKSLQNVFMAKPVVQLDPALYEVESVRRDFEEMWGIQQALQGGIQKEQTATEADIQQQGFAARTNFMREPLESMLQEMAVATAEILLQRLTLEDAREYAGEGAEWPEAATVADLATLVNVQIKAGSTGKPNTASERNAWNNTAPVLTQMVEKIGMLRGASPQSVADSLQRIAEITLQLSGSSVNAEEVIPQESMPTVDPAQQQPGAAPMEGPAPTAGAPEAPTPPAGPGPAAAPPPM